MSKLEQENKKEIKFNFNDIDNFFNPERTGDDWLLKLLPQNFFQEFEKGNFNKRIYPKFSDRASWNALITNQYSQEIIKNADFINENFVPQILYADFKIFITQGNRTILQDKYFLRRKNLAFLALALCLTGNKEKYMPRLLNYIIAILEEFSWCLHAHLKWNETTLLEDRPCDLFACETGAVLALLVHILGDELDKEIENISDKIRTVVLERTVYNVLYPKKLDNGNFWFTMAKPNNWAVWCGYNCLICSALLENNYKRLAIEIREFFRIVSYYAYCQDDDGFCSEGPMYYSKSSLKLFASLSFLDKLVPGAADKIFAIPKIRNIFEFLGHICITDDYFVNFADALCNFSAALEDCIPCARKCCNRNIKLGSNGDYLITGLKILFDVKEVKECIIDDNEFSYFPNRLAVFRSNKFSISLKGGHNAESHNHNDLGHVTVFYKGKPVIVDAGSNIYSKINFSDERYSLWYTRGSGHNAPVLGEIEQLEGPYKVNFIKENSNIIHCNLREAYPEYAGIKDAVRSIIFNPDSVVIKDNFILNNPCCKSICLLSPIDAEVVSSNKIILGDVAIELNNIKVDKIEFAEQMDNGWIDRPLTMIKLIASEENYSIIFSEKIIE